MRFLSPFLKGFSLGLCRPSAPSISSFFFISSRQMLDINIFREEKGYNSDIIRESLERRSRDPSLVDEIINLDKTWRKCQFEKETLNSKVNKMTKEINRLKMLGEDATKKIKIIEETKMLKAKKEAEVQEVKMLLDARLATVGNLVHDSAPINDDEDNNEVIRSWGEKHIEKNLKNHVELSEHLGIVDLEKGANVAGDGEFYLQGDVVILREALTNFGLHFLLKRNYMIMQNPSFLNKDVMARCRGRAHFDEDLQKVTGEGDDKYLISSPEQPLCAYHIDEWFHPSELPFRYGGYSTCSHKEAGSNGLDDPGTPKIVEQFCVTSPNNNESWTIFEELIKVAEDFYKELNIPYRIVSVVSGALNDAAAKKYILEGWFPGSKTYRPLVSCSNCTDYHSRALEVRYGHATKKSDQLKQYVHLVTSTLIETEKTICCILENYQKEDRIKVPKSLQSFMCDITFLLFMTSMPTMQKERNQKPKLPSSRKISDTDIFREERGYNSEIIRESVRRRFQDSSIVNEIINLDKAWRQRQFEKVTVDSEVEKMMKEISRLKMLGEDATEKIKNMEATKTLQAEKEAEVGEAKALLDAKLATVGNVVHDSVPTNNDEDNNEVIRSWGEKRIDDKMKSHAELVEQLGIADFRRGARVAGNRGFYLLGAGLLLNRALVVLGLYFLRKRNYKQMAPPSFMKKDVMAKCAQLAQFDEELYKVTSGGDDKYLIATAEQPLCAYHMDECIHASELPIRYAGYSTCFRKEAGNSKDAKGIFRVHEFDKVEQFCVTSPNDNESWTLFEEMITNAEDFYKELNIPYQVVSVVSGALNNAAAKKYDLEGWFPASKTYRELVSCSNCTDYQSRALGIRYGSASNKSGGAEEYVHLLNSTLTATQRTMCCILENYQTETGVEIPPSCQRLMGDITALSFPTSVPKKPNDRNQKHKLSNEEGCCRHQQ